MIQRLNDHQFLTDTPIQEIYQAGVRVLKVNGVANAAIDAAQSEVSGSAKAPGHPYDENASIRVEIRAEGTLVSVFFVPSASMNVDYEGAKFRAGTVSQQLESSLTSGFTSQSRPVEPIADPVTPPMGGNSGGYNSYPGSYPPGGSGPFYSNAQRPKRGTLVLIFGLAGCFCPCTGPLALYWGFQALKESKQYRDTDTGDMILVSIGMVLGAIQTLFLLAFLVEFVKELIHPTTVTNSVTNSVANSVTNSVSSQVPTPIPTP